MDEDEDRPTGGIRHERPPDTADGRSRRTANGPGLQAQATGANTKTGRTSAGDAGKEHEAAMTINLKMPDITELKPRITVFGVGGAGGNAVNNMIASGLQGCDFVVANTDAQALALTRADRMIQMGIAVTEGLGAGSQPEVGSAAAEEVIDEINDHLAGSHMVFITAGMGGGTGTGAAPVIARAARAMGILTVGVVTKPFHFEGARRMRIAEAGIEELQKSVDTLIVIPNQNLFRIANERTTFADAFSMADQVLYSGVACITDLMVKEGLINLDFADVRSIMRGMGKAMMGTGEASGEKRAMQAAEAAISNPLLDETSMKGARGLLISITGGKDLTLFELDEAATRIREEVDSDANIILGATFDDNLEGIIRVSVVATGIDKDLREEAQHTDPRVAELNMRGRAAQAQPAPSQPVRQPSPTAQTQAAQLRAAELARATALAAVEAGLDQRYNEAPKAAEAYPATDAETGYLEQALDEVSAYAETEEAEFVPPVVEQAAPAPRVPRMEDFPPHAQREIAQRSAPPATRTEAEEDRRPVSLLRRIANGLSRRDDHAETREAEVPSRQPRTQAPSHQAPAHQAYAPPARQPAAGPAPAPASEFTRRPAPAQRPPASPDSYHRPRGVEADAPTSRAPSREDDQLEIPAFLRRQAN